MSTMKRDHESVAPSDLARAESLYSLTESEMPHSCGNACIADLSPSPPESVCSDVHMHAEPCRLPFQTDADIPFDATQAVCDVVGYYLACQIDSCRLPQCPSPFDAVTEPKITLPCYCERIQHYSKASAETIICATVLIHRVARSGGLKLTMRNCHRLLVTAIMVFSKFYDDEIDSNARWARIAGVKKVEINNLEVEFLNRCHFDLRVSTEEFHDMVNSLAVFKDGHSPTEATVVSDEPTTPRKKHVWTFHVKSRVKSEGEKESGSKTTHHHPHKSIMAFFQHTNHAHLERFPRTNCSPGSTISASSMPTPEQKGGMERSISSTFGMSSDSMDSDRGEMARKHMSLPRGRSGLHLSALLHTFEKRHPKEHEH